jgi:tRNA(His) 5'-end guanylyltransferase
MEKDSIGTYLLEFTVIDHVLLIRLFTRFSDAHGFAKPNDKAALDLMDRAAKRVMEEVPDVVVGFGESDEYR